MAGKQVTELDALPSFTDTSLLPVHNGAGLKKGLLSQLADYLGKKFSNPNLLINPDFKINQRGETSYTSEVAHTIKNVYSVDRWYLYGHSLTVNSDNSVTITPTTYSDGALIQQLETPVEGNITIQVYVVGVSGTATVSVGPYDGSSTTEIGTLKNGLNTFTFSRGIKRLVIRVNSGTLTLKYAKVEQGSIATKFVEPNKSEELAKCKRFTQYYDSIPCIPGILFVENTTGATSGWLPLYQILSPSMRVVPTISVFNVMANNGNIISGNYSVNLDNNRLKSVVFKEASNYHTITINKVLLDAEIY